MLGFDDDNHIFHSTNFLEAHLDVPQMVVDLEKKKFSRQRGGYLVEYKTKLGVYLGHVGPGQRSSKSSPFSYWAN